MKGCAYGCAYVWIRGSVKGCPCGSTRGCGCGCQSLLAQPAVAGICEAAFSLCLSLGWQGLTPSPLQSSRRSCCLNQGNNSSQEGFAATPSAPHEQWPASWVMLRGSTACALPSHQGLVAAERVRILLVPLPFPASWAPETGTKGSDRVARTSTSLAPSFSPPPWHPRILPGPRSMRGRPRSRSWCSSTHGRAGT